MQRLEVGGAVRFIYGSLGVKRLTCAVISMNGCIPDVLKDTTVAELGGAGSKNRDAVHISLSWSEAEL